MERQAGTPLCPWIAVPWNEVQEPELSWFWVLVANSQGFGEQLLPHLRTKGCVLSACPQSVGFHRAQAQDLQMEVALTSQGTWLSMAEAGHRGPSVVDRRHLNGWGLKEAHPLGLFSPLAKAPSPFSPHPPASQLSFLLAGAELTHVVGTLAYKPPVSCSSW